MLVTNTETIIEEIDNNDRVQVEDVAKLWRGSSFCPPLMSSQKSIPLTSSQSTLSTVLISKPTRGQGYPISSGEYGAIDPSAARFEAARWPDCSSPSPREVTACGRPLYRLLSPPPRSRIQYAHLSKVEGTWLTTTAGKSNFSLRSRRLPSLGDEQTSSGESF